MNIVHGDCLEVMRGMADNSVDSIVTDPPYGLSFMGKKWDYDVPGVDIWRECLRVLKPGGHLLSFAGTRTQHRMACAIEDAGFEIRDMIAWVYGSGFPKSLDVSKAIDKAAGVEREVIGFDPVAAKRTAAVGTNAFGDYKGQSGDITAPATDAARQWQGWGTALKPALEPITVARKPLVGTVAANVLEWGTGALNIDGCRVGFVDDADKAESVNKNQHADYNSNNGIRVPTKGIYHGDNRPPENYNPTKGRFPANLIHDGSEEVVGLFPNAGNGHWSYKPAKDGGIYKYGLKDMPDGGSDKTVSSAARFFYCAKASRSERNAGLEGMPEKRPDERTNTGMGTFVEKGVAKQSNHHPTVKPIELMRYLVRLVTPPGGIVLDPFAGSGSTGVACAEEGFGFIGIEREAEYCEIARARIAAVDVGLFGAAL
jgi:DNA modification methylase